MQSTDFFTENGRVVIADGVKTIQSGVLPTRDFISIQIPKTVETIYPNVISCDVTYDGIPISKEEIAQYGCENIPRIATFKKYQVDYTKMEREVFLLLPLTNDAIKGYQSNHNHYRSLRQLVSLDKEDDIYFFKICYTMGLFVVPPKTRLEVEKAITEIYQYGKFSSWDYFKHWPLREVNLVFIQLVLGWYREGRIFEFMPYYGKMYSKCKEVCHIIRRIKEQKIYEVKKKLSGPIYVTSTNQEEQIESIYSLRQELTELQSRLKTISITDIQDYFLNHTFVTRPGNEALEDIMPIIKAHVYSQSSFDLLQDIYEEARRAKEEMISIYTPLEGTSGEYTYRWLENDSIENLILGYLVNCCATLDGAGEGIMRLSMTHPQVRTLVIYDSLDKIIGKTTVFYSLEGKYLLGNTIEVANSFILTSKTTRKQKDALLQAFLKGLQAQVTAMEKIGYMVSEVRVGMLRNNLEESLKEYKIEKQDLLPNIAYGSYIGDASNHKEGQAILIEKEVNR